MRKILQRLLLLLLAGLGLPAAAQRGAMVQSVNFGSILAGIGNTRIATDPAGNTYMAGSWDDSLEVAGTRLTRAPGDTAANLYVAKFDVTGQLLWLQHGGGTQQEYVFSLALDGVGGLYLMGIHGVDFQFGPSTIAHAGTFLLKLDAATGAVQWGRSVLPPGGGGVVATAMTADASGAYMTMGLDGCSMLDQLPIQGHLLGRVGVLAHCSPTGTFTQTWQCVPTTAGAQLVMGDVSLAEGGNVFVSVGVTGTHQLGTASGAPIHTAPPLPPNQLETFVARVFPNSTGGALAWVLPTMPGLNALSADKARGCFFAGNAPAGSVFGTVALADSGIYVGRIDHAGQVRWVKGTNSGRFEQVYDLTTGPSGQLYTAGNLISLSIKVGPYTVHNSPSGGFTTFVACHDSLGAVQWAVGPDNPSGILDFTHSISVDSANRVYIAGITNYAVAYGGQAARPHSAFLFRLDPAAEVRGHVFLDPNGNGIHEAGEPPYPRPVVVSEVSRPYGGMSSVASGRFTLFPDTGQYQIHVPRLPTYYSLSQGAGGYSGHLRGYGQVDSGYVFLLAPDANRHDVRVTLTAFGNARRGFANRYRATIENVGTTVAAGSLTVQFDPVLQYSGAATPPTSSTPTSATWSFANLAPFEVRNFDLAATPPINLPLDTLVYSSATVTTTDPDLTPANNHSSVVQRVTGSYDPNDLSVNYDRLTPAQVAAGTPLDYVVRFQNLGNDTAFTVVVTDTLPAHLLQLGTLELLSASHSCWYELVGSSQLVIHFERVNLPPSSTNLLGSMGFARFQVKPGAALGVGTLIPNAAHIFFDFNAPIATNDVSTLVAIPNGLVAASAARRWDLYPNPASRAAGCVTLTTAVPAPGRVTVQLHDLLGRPVGQQTLAAPAGTLTHQLDVRRLPAGLFVVRLAFADGTTSSQVLSVAP